MNPNDVPVKFKLNTRVKLTHRGIYNGFYGTIVGERTNGYNNRVELDSGSIGWFSDYELVAVTVPNVGDLVKIKASGRWQAKEGNVSSIDTKGNVFVDLGDDWDTPHFKPEQLEVIESFPAPVDRKRRVEGAPIQPEAVKRGDVISIVTVEDGDIKKTSIIEATVGQVIEKNFYVHKFLTAKGNVIFETNNTQGYTISLVKAIDNDVEYQQLSETKMGEVIGFPDEDGGVETNIAIKQIEDFWSVVLGTKKAKTMDTSGLVTLLRKKNVTFSVIRKAPEEFEFPKGTRVKVFRSYSESMAQLEWKVIIEGEEKSVIKSTGISASTYTVPNRYLTKG